MLIDLSQEEIDVLLEFHAKEAKSMDSYKRNIHWDRHDELLYITRKSDKRVAVTRPIEGNISIS